MNTAPNQNLNIFEQINSVCRAYRQGLKDGKPKSIESCLELVDESGRENLFRNILHVDIEFRRRSGENPSSTEYIERFPQFKRIVKESFFESTLMSMQSEEETSLGDQTVSISPPPARRLGDYELLRELGRGGFGVVYLAKHMERDDRVALKTLPMGGSDQESTLHDAERLHKFRREFRSLAEIHHPNLVGMQNLEVDGTQWFFTMDLVQGVDFLSYVRNDHGVVEERLRQTLPQLAHGIMALHSRQILHRDLKPSNVMVTDEGNVIILDFGLVDELQDTPDYTASLGTQHFAGTPRYAAPEQVFGKRSPASDWYAFGVMLFEAMTGEPPFSGPHLELFHRKQNEEPPQLKQRSEFPADLAKLADRLLAREPDQRPDANQIADTLEMHESIDSEDSIDTIFVPADSTSGPILIGRDEQLNVLRLAKQELLESGQSQVVFISGRSGEGKSSLAEAFTRPLGTDPNVLVLSGRCYDRESVPFKAIDTLIDALVGFLRSRSTDFVAEILPDDIAVLAHLFPLLRRVQTIADRCQTPISDFDSREIQSRAFASLRELLRLLSKRLALIFLVDDLQWGDADSAEALFQILSGADVPNMMLLGTYRSDEAAESPFLKEWRSRQDAADLPVQEQTVMVTPLNEQQCIDLMRARFGDSSEFDRKLIPKLFESAQGNPYFLEQLADSVDWASGDVEGFGLTDIISARLRHLSEDAARLLEVVAVSGQALSVAEAAKVSGRTSPVFATLTHMRNEKLVRLINVGEKQLVDTYHDKIRESVLASMEPGIRSGLHLRFGEAIEAQEEISGDDILQSLSAEAQISSTTHPISPRIVDLAFHFHAANHNRGFVYQLLAGVSALNAHANESALQHLLKAEATLPETVSQDAKYRLWVSLGSCNFRLGEPDLAIKYMQLAKEFATNTTQRAWVEELFAVNYNLKCQFSKSAMHVDKALSLFGVQRPKSALGRILSINLSAIQILCVPKFLSFRATPSKSVEKSQHRLLNFLQAIALDSNYLEGSEAVLRLGVMSKYATDPVISATGYAKLAGMLAACGTPILPTVYLKRAMRIGLPADNSQEFGFAVFGIACVNYLVDTSIEAIDNFERSSRIMTRSGDNVHAIMAKHFARHACNALDSAQLELEIAREELQTAEDTRNYRVVCWGNYGIATALARMGSVKDAQVYGEQAYQSLPEEKQIISASVCRFTNGYVAMQASNYRSATEQLENAWRDIRKEWAFTEFTMATLPHLLECKAGANWTDRKPSGKRELVRLCRIAAMLQPSFPTLRPHLLRSRGRAYYSIGKQAKGRRLLRKAVRVARKLNLRHSLARCLLDLAAVQTENRQEMRDEAVELLKTTTSVIPYAERWQLGDHPDESCYVAESESWSEP